MQHRVLPTSMPDRPPRFIPYIYSTEDIRRLLGVPDSHYPRTCPLSPDTMRTLILVLYGTGLRLGEVSRLTHADADFRNAALHDSGNEVRQVATGSDRKGSCQHPQTLPNAPSSGCGVPTPTDTPRHKDRDDDPKRSCRPPIRMAEKGGRGTAI